MEPLEYLKKIEQSGFKAYIVGGYVRDSLLGIPSNDIDITTNATPKDIKKIFGITNSDNFGSINIKNSNWNVDITTFRKEDNYDSHVPNIVEYVDDLMTDLQRRDFTINTICMDSSGKIIDLLNGVNDLNKKRIIAVGNINKKFSEDPLRMLRALRLSIIYEFEIGDRELEYIKNNKHLFKFISYNRKKSELGKILISNNSQKGLKLLKELELLDVLEINYFDNIKCFPDYIGMWAQINFSDKYPFTNLEKNRISNIRNIIKMNDINKNTIFKYGYYDSLVAGKIIGININKISSIYSNMPITSLQDLKVSGADIMSILNISPSKLVKDILDKITEQVLLGNLNNNFEDIEEYILKIWK